MNRRMYFIHQGFILPWAGLFMLVILAGVGLFVKNSWYLSPGEVSAMHPRDETLGGYVSHADFEMECGHCHAPLHCVTDDRCQDCHMTVAQQRVEGQGLHARLPGTERCQNCHVEHQGRDASITVLAYANVDHDQLSGYSLEQHSIDYEDQPMDCQSCHQQRGYAAETLDCVTCHAQADHDFMAEHLEVYGTTCVPCHDGRGRMKDFEHADAYPLEARHAEAECGDCHSDHIFMQAARDCVDCHADPKLHNGKFGQDCARCHTAEAWAPAYLLRHNFYLDHGSGQENRCETCHLENYTDQTCYNCHDHQPDQMRQVHLDEGISEYQDCAICHPTGVSGEAASLRESGVLPGIGALRENGEPAGPLGESGEPQETKYQYGPQAEEPEAKEDHHMPLSGNK